MIVWLHEIWHDLAWQVLVLYKRFTGNLMHIPIVTSTGLIDKTRVNFFSLVSIGKKIYANLEVDGVFFTCPATADILELINNSFPGVKIDRPEPGEIGEKKEIAEDLSLKLKT